MVKVLSIADGDTIRTRQAGKGITASLLASLDSKTTEPFSGWVAEVFSGINIKFARVKTARTSTNASAWMVAMPANTWREKYAPDARRWG